MPAGWDGYSVAGRQNLPLCGDKTRHGDRCRAGPGVFRPYAITDRSRDGSGNYRQIRPGGLRVYPGVFCVRTWISFGSRSHRAAHGYRQRTLADNRADSVLSADDVAVDAHRKVGIGTDVDRIFSRPHYVSGGGERYTGRGGFRRGGFRRGGFRRRVRPDDASLRIAHMYPEFRSSNAGHRDRYVVLIALDKDPGIGGSGSPTGHGSCRHNGDGPGAQGLNPDPAGAAVDGGNRNRGTSVLREVIQTDSVLATENRTLCADHRVGGFVCATIDRVSTVNQMYPVVHASAHSSRRDDGRRTRYLVCCVDALLLPDNRLSARPLLDAQPGSSRLGRDCIAIPSNDGRATLNHHCEQPRSAKNRRSGRDCPAAGDIGPIRTGGAACIVEANDTRKGAQARSADGRTNPVSRDTGDCDPARNRVRPCGCRSWT